MSSLSACRHGVVLFQASVVCVRALVCLPFVLRMRRTKEQTRFDGGQERVPTIDNDDANGAGRSLHLRGARRNSLCHTMFLSGCAGVFVGVVVSSLSQKVWLTSLTEMAEGLRLLSRGHLLRLEQ